MATRRYLSLNSPGVVMHGAPKGAWSARGGFITSYSPVQFTHLLQASNVNCGTRVNRTARNNQAAPYDELWMRWVLEPVQAQTLTGTLQLCWMVRCRWNDGLGGFDSSATARFKVHAYVCQGDDVRLVRGVLLNNYIDTVDFPGHLSGQTWRSLASAQALSSVDMVAGDRPVVEIGFRYNTMPADTPGTPPTKFAEIEVIAAGATSTDSDATAGSGISTLNPWVEFSQNITFQAAPAAPANDACADAINLTSETLPYHGPNINASTSTDTRNALWWEWTCPETARYTFHCFGTNYDGRVRLFTGACGSLTTVATSSPLPATHRCAALVVFDCTQGVTYKICLDAAQSSLSLWGPLAGAGRIGIFKNSIAAQENDLYIPNGTIFAIRDGGYAIAQNALITSAPTGIAIDYTNRPIDDLNGGTHSRERVLLAMHSGFLEIVDAHTLNVLQFEVDTMFADFSSQQHPAQLAIDSAGMMWVGCFGNGYRYVVGQGALPAFLDGLSSPIARGYLRRKDASEGDSQPGATFTSDELAAAAEHTGAWAIAIDEVAGVLYYTSSGLYVQAGATPDLIKRWDIVNDVQLSDFASLALDTTSPAPGLRGLCVLPAALGGGLLVCNGSIVQRLSSGGAVTQTYTPSILEDATTLTAIGLTSDGLAFWVCDLASTRLFKFEIATGTELETFQLYGAPGTLVQLVTFLPNGVTVDVDECAPLIDPVGCWSPGQTPVGCGPSSGPIGASGCWSGFSQATQRISRSTGGVNES